MHYSIIFFAFLNNIAKTLRRNGKEKCILYMCLPFETAIVCWYCFLFLYTSVKIDSICLLMIYFVLL